MYYLNFEFRLKAFDAEIKSLQETNDLLLLQKRQLEADREELEEMRSRGGQLSSEEKRRLETQIARLEEDLEEEQSSSELANDKLRKAQLQVFWFLWVMLDYSGF